MTRIRPIRKLRSIPHKRWMILGAIGLILAGLNIYSRYQPIHKVVKSEPTEFLMISFIDGYFACIWLHGQICQVTDVRNKNYWLWAFGHSAAWQERFRLSHRKTDSASTVAFLILDQLLLLVILAIYPLIAGICALVRHRRRIRANLCTRCGYCLTGNVTGICSECGTPIAATTAGAAAP